MIVTVSYIIPAYNHQDYVAECLDSIVADCDVPFEIILIDDGSSDQTYNVVKKWSEDNEDISINMASRENRGVVRTLNELIGKARGEFIVPIASDDLLLKGGTASRIRYLKANEDKLAVFSDCIVIDKHGRKIHASGLTGLYSANLDALSKGGRALLYEMISNWSIPGPVLMLRKEVFDTVGVYNSQLNVEDWDFYIRLSAHEVIGFLNEKVSCYRVHGSNVCMAEGERASMFLQSLRCLFYNLNNVDMRAKFLLIKQIIRFIKIMLLMKMSR